MSYNSLADVKEILGVDCITQAQLNIAKSYIDNYSRYRWTATEEVLRFSPDIGFPGRIFLNMPITTFTYLKTVDESTTPETLTTLTRFTDYDYDQRTGLLFFVDRYINYYITSTPRLNSFEVSYTYGFDNTNVNYQKVRFAEAQIALLINKNPMMFSEVNLSGDTAKFSENPIRKILMQAVQQRPRVQGIGGVGPEAVNAHAWNMSRYADNQWVCY